MKQVRNVLIVGCGHMGRSHAKAYHENENFKIVGLVSRSGLSSGALNKEFGNIYEEFNNYSDALQKSKPDIVVISTYTEYHAKYAIQAMESGAHVFVEKPLGSTLESAKQVIETANRLKKKLVVGYILQVHPGWNRFIEVAKTLGKPLVMRMNLNQQSTGENWRIHKNLLASTSPIVDCGVHYVDIMGKMTQSEPLEVHAIGAKLTNEIADEQFNYGQLQVKFADGSIGWYEVGWGPMMSDNAYFIKDVIGPKGSASIVGNKGNSSDHVDDHVGVHTIKLNRSSSTEVVHEYLSLEDEPDHDALCKKEQEILINAIDNDDDLNHHYNDIINSMKIVFAADLSIKTGEIVKLS